MSKRDSDRTELDELIAETFKKVRMEGLTPAQMLAECWTPDLTTPEPIFDMSKPLEPVDKYRLDKKPHPDKPYLLDREPLTNYPCVVIINEGGQVHELGDILATGEVSGKKLAVRCFIDFGRLGEPMIRIDICRARKKNGVINLKNSDTYTYTKIHWYPGVKLDEKENNTTWQLQSVGAEYGADIWAGEFRFVKTGQLGSLAQEDIDRLVGITIQGQSPHISQSQNTGIMVQENQGSLRAVITHLVSSAKAVRLLVAFLLPPRPNSVDQFRHQFAKFQGDASSQLPPLYQYLTVDHKDFDIDIDMPAVNMFCNRSLAIWHKDTQAKMDQSKDAAGQIGIWEPADEIRKLREKTMFLSSQHFGIHVILAITRREQFRQAMVVKLQRADIGFKFVRPAGAALLDDVPVDRDSTQGLLQRSMYMIGTLPTGDISPPQEGSMWEVDFPLYDAAGRAYMPGDKALRFKAYCVPMTPEESSTVGGGDFMLVTTANKLPQYLPVAESFESWHQGFKSRKGQMRLINDLVPFDRIINATKTVCANHDNLYQDLLPLLVYGQSQGKRLVVDVTLGPKGGLTGRKKEGRQAKWRIGVKGLQEIVPGLTETQKEFISNSAKKIWGKVMAVVGGPGCAKTLTLAWLVLMLAAQGHKVLVLSRNNHAVNKFMVALEEGKRRFVNWGANAGQLDGDVEMEPNEQLMEAREAVKAGRTNYAKGMSALELLRFMPPAMEHHALAGSKAASIDNDTFKAYEPQNDYIGDSTAQSAIFQLITLTRTEMELVELTHERGKEETHDQSHKRMSDANEQLTEVRAKIDKQQQLLQAIVSSYDRLPLRSRKGFSFPVNHAMAFKIQEHGKKLAHQNAAEGQADVAMGGAQHSTFNDALTAYNAAVATLQLPPEQIPDRQAAESTAKMAADTLFKQVIRLQNVVGTSYVNSQHPTIRDVFRPTVVVHEAASLASVSDAMCGFVYEDAQCHILLGDIKQIGPFDEGDEFSEVGWFNKMSILKFVINKGVVPHVLREQFRMAPSIAQFVNTECFNGQLKNAPNVQDSTCSDEEKCIRETCREVIWKRYADYSPHDTDWNSQYYMVNLVNSKSGPQGPSQANHTEAEAVAELVHDLVQSGIEPSQITVICHYRGQVFIISKILEKLKLAGFLVANPVNVTTVDTYQGDENDVVILATTVTANRASGQGGSTNNIQVLTKYFKSSERWTVALSRAKHLCVVFGNWSSLINVTNYHLNIKEDLTYTTIWNLMVDGVTRKVMLLDRRLNRAQSMKVESTGPGLREVETDTEKHENLSWIADKRFQPQKARNYGDRSGNRESWAGPTEGTALGVLPPSELRKFESLDLGIDTEAALRQKDTVAAHNRPAAGFPPKGAGNKPVRGSKEGEGLEPGEIVDAGQSRGRGNRRGRGTSPRNAGSNCGGGFNRRAGGHGGGANAFNAFTRQSWRKEN